MTNKPIHCFFTARRHHSGTGLRRLLTLALGLLLCAPAGADGASETETPPEFRRTPPLRSMREAARAAGFQLEGFAQPRAGKMKAGDAVTALVTWSDGNRLKQWIIGMEADEPTEAEKKQAPESLQFHTSPGNRFRLGGGRAALKLRVAGPLEDKDAGTRKAMTPQVNHQRIPVSPDYLELGLDRLPALMLRMNAAGKTNPSAEGMELNIAQDPFPPEAVAAARKRLARMDGGLKPRREDEIGFIGAVLAMQEFFFLANGTPGIQEMLRSVLDVPWWSIISRGGAMEANFTVLPMAGELDGAPWGLPAADRLHTLPCRLEINGKPCLLIRMAVTRPRPPLTVSAGVIGFAAGPVNGWGPVLTFQIVSTRTRLPKK